MKQRLWGAAVLIALAVIFLPMLVKGPAPDSGVSDVPLDSPKAPDATVKTQELPLDVPGAVGANGATGMPAAQASAETPTSTTAPAQPAAPAATDPKPSPTTAAGDYAVSFGSYGSSSDADRVVQAVNGIKLHGYSEKVSLAGRDAWRVRIGPYPTREAAEVARVQAVQLNPQVKAQVIALDANATQAPAATAAPTPAIATTPIASSKPAEKPVEDVAPAAPKPAAETATKPKPTTPATKPDKAIAATKPAKPVQATEPKPVVAQHQDTPVAPKPDQPKPEPKPADKPAASGTGFAVQLGAFANAAEATALRDKARAAGFSATTDTVKTDKGTLTRVRLGPVVGRDAANALKTRAQSTLGVSGIVRPSP